jgi:hypothetical protein
MSTKEMLEKAASREAAAEMQIEVECTITTLYHTEIRVS